MNREDYEKYHKKGGFYEIPVEIFNELLDEIEEKIKQLKKDLENTIVINNAEIGAQVGAIVSCWNKSIDERDKYKQQLEQKNKVIEKVEKYIDKFDLLNESNFMDDGVSSLFQDILNILNEGVYE